MVGNADKARLPELLRPLLDGAATARPGIEVGDSRRRPGWRRSPLGRSGRSRAFVKVQDGCQHRCAFCIVPLARGASRSLDPEVVLDQVRRARRGRAPRSRADRRRPGPLRRRPRAAHDAWPRCCDRSSRSRASAGCGSRRCCPAYFTPELLEIVDDGAGDRAALPHPAAERQRPGAAADAAAVHDARCIGALVRAAGRRASRARSGRRRHRGLSRRDRRGLRRRRCAWSRSCRSRTCTCSRTPRGAGTEAAGLAGRLDVAHASRRGARRLREAGRGEERRAFGGRLVGTARGRARAGDARPATGDLVGLTGNYVEVTFPGPSADAAVARVRVTACRTAGDGSCRAGLPEEARAIDERDEPAIGIIGGSGLYELEGLSDVRWRRVRTPFGDPSDEYCVRRGSTGGRVVFLPRHGRGHRLTPSELNFRANIWGLKSLGAEWVISISAVGSMREAIHAARPGHPRPVLRRHHAGACRRSSATGIVAHVGMAEPVCPTWPTALEKAARQTRRHRPPRRAPTSASRGRSSRRRPSRASIGAGAST